MSESIIRFWEYWGGERFALVLGIEGERVETCRRTGIRGSVLDGETKVSEFVRAPGKHNYLNWCKAILFSYKMDIEPYHFPQANTE